MYLLVSNSNKHAKLLKKLENPFLRAMLVHNILQKRNNESLIDFNFL